MRPNVGDCRGQMRAERPADVEPALHAHVFPRYADEPHAQRTAQPWALDWELAPSFSVATHGDLRQRIATWIEWSGAKGALGASESG